jgi:hypothetical protein
MVEAKHVICSYRFDGSVAALDTLSFEDKMSEEYLKGPDDLKGLPRPKVS